MKKRILIIFMTVVSAFVSVFFTGCSLRNPLPWWEDYMNLVYLVTDGWEETEDYIFTDNTKASSIVFQYQLDEMGVVLSADGEQRFEVKLPLIEVYHKGEKKKVYYEYKFSRLILDDRLIDGEIVPMWRWQGFTLEEGAVWDRMTLNAFYRHNQWIFKYADFFGVDTNVYVDSAKTTQINTQSFFASVSFYLKFD